MTPLLAHALCQTLLHHGSGEDAVTQLNVDRQEFKDAYYAIDKKLPGLTLDFDKLAASDPVESDPLISQGNLAILRLDDLYRETYHAWRSYSQGQELNSSKRTIKPGSTAARTDSTHQTEIATKQLPPDATLINQAVNILLTSFKIQATITHRREQILQRSTATRLTAPRSEALPEPQEPLSPNNSAPSQPAAPASDQSQPADPSTSPSQPAASARAAHDDLIQPYSPLQAIGSIHRIPALKPLAPLDPLTHCQQPDTPPTAAEFTAATPPAPPDPSPSASKPGSESTDQELSTYIELPPYDAISYQPPDVQDFLRTLKEKPQFANTS